MATTLPVVSVPFQGYLDLASAGNMTDVPAGLEFEFVNDGYTILVVENNAMATNEVTVTSVADNAGRTEDIVFDVPAIAGGVSNITIFGPFRPIWWNQAGVVTVTFENNTTIKAGAIKLLF